jgi:hypothetical protein
MALPVVFGVGVIVNAASIESSDHASSDCETYKEAGADSKPDLLAKFAVDDRVFVGAGNGLG